MSCESHTQDEQGYNETVPGTSAIFLVKLNLQLRTVDLFVTFDTCSVPIND